MRRLLALVALGAVFVRELVIGGAMTAWYILRPGPRPQPALVPMTYEGLSPTGAALLACLITLTPGTSAVDVDVDRRRLLLHLLDGGDPDTAIAAIRQRFERRLRPVFPEAPR